MNNEEDLNIPQPDPAWDYYTVWHSCLHIKAKIDEALKVMGDGEDATVETDEEVRKILDLASDKLIEVCHQLEHDDDDDI